MSREIAVGPWECPKCRISTVVAYDHPTLGLVCAVCLGPRWSGKRGRRGKRRSSRKALPPSKRLLKVGERDGWICHLCEKPVEVKQASVDHLLPRSWGGSNAMRNLKLAHKSCNGERGNALLSAYPAVST